MIKISHLARDSTESL